MPVQLFAPHDPLVPMNLKARIGKWMDTVPSSQFQQYGPLNKYFNRKFKRVTHMIKPQPLFRQPIDDEDNRLLLEWGDGYLPEDRELPGDDEPELRDRIEALREERDVGNLTIDSTNQGYAWRSSLAGEKCYPDFAICEHYDTEDDKNPSEMNRFDKEDEFKDRVRMIVEIASLPRDLKEAALARLRRKTLEQLIGYMDDLGDRGDRWDDDEIMGMALVGIHAAFLKPHPDRRGEWVHQGLSWYSIFGPVFQEMMDEAVGYGQTVTDSESDSGSD